MNKRRTTYRAYAIGFSIVAHALVLLVGKFLFIESKMGRQEFVIVDFSRREQPPSVPPTIIRKQSRAGERKGGGQQIVPEKTQPVEIPAISPDQPAEVSEQEVIKRALFGDSLYAIVTEFPQLKPLVLKQMLVQNVQAYDSLETLRQQIALALAPYLDMSDAERAARANMKRFGYAHNPYQAQAIPGNIPISDIILFLIRLITR
ncbi:MAG: hypothetical protein ACRDGA_02620 [Bacteroidota bacterium]